MLQSFNTVNMTTTVAAADDSKDTISTIHNDRTGLVTIKESGVIPQVQQSLTLQPRTETDATGALSMTLSGTDKDAAATRSSESFSTLHESVLAHRNDEETLSNVRHQCHV
jgi:hypothetical protein